MYTCWYVEDYCQLVERANDENATIMFIRECDECAGFDAIVIKREDKPMAHFG